MNYEAVGVTDERTECDCCGKINLKKTVVLRNEDGEFSFFGTTCAARALGKRASTPAQARKAVRDSIADTKRADHAAKIDALIATSDKLAALLGWEYRPSEEWGAFANGWLRWAAPKFAMRAKGEALALVITMLELRKETTR